MFLEAGLNGHSPVKKEKDLNIETSVHAQTGGTTDTTGEIIKLESLRRPILSLLALH